MAREARAEPVSITTARAGHSADLQGRQRRYLLSMLLRTICFVLAVVTTGWARWVFVAAALFLPYVAVVLANATNRRNPVLAEKYTPQPFGILGSHAAAPAEPQVVTPDEGTTDEPGAYERQWPPTEPPPAADQSTGTGPEPQRTSPGHSR